jgi:EAL domain-containing protein (putative c-di-GMP-specific phosphodiesterase class I)
MSDQSAPQQVSPLKMRNLRAGRTAVASRSDADDPPITRGPVETREEFDRSLNHVIGRIDQDGTSVVVFKLTIRALSLDRVGQGCPGTVPDPSHDAVTGVLLGQEVDLVFLPVNSHEVLGFVVDRGRVEAERVLARLLSSLSGVLPTGSSAISIAPQLGAVFVGGQITDGDLAVDAAGVTVGQTSVSAPFLLYNDYVFQRGDREFQIGQTLPQAVAANEIGLEFQPRTATKGNLVTGIEAFARWSHPRLGTVGPAEFLRIADKLDIMGDLGRRLRDRAVGSAVAWFREAWLQDANLWLNVSYTELCRNGFAASLSELRNQYPEVRFGIEIKDGPLLDEPVVVSQLEPIRRLGIEIALDNVGAAAISLGRLHRLPLSAVNLDGAIVHSLVSDPSFQHLVATICEIAHGRGIAVTACQTETREQLSTVRSLGIDQVQGQVLSEPIPASRVRDLLASGLSAEVDRRSR